MAVRIPQQVHLDAGLRGASNGGVEADQAVSAEHACVENLALLLEAERRNAQGCCRQMFHQRGEGPCHAFAIAIYDHRATVRESGGIHQDCDAHGCTSSGWPDMGTPAWA